MILIKQNSSNNCVFTLNELITGTYSYDFLFQFTNDTTGEVKIFTANDISPATTRYNQFTIIENQTENLYNGTIHLDPVGYWSYEVFQMNQESPPNLSPTYSVGLLEIGKVLVQSQTQSVTTSFDLDEDKDNVVFDLPD